MIRLFDKSQEQQQLDFLKRSLMIFCTQLLNQNAQSDDNADPKIFISYHDEATKPEETSQDSHLDGRAIADHIHQIIENDYPGLESFFAPKSIRAGDKHKEKIAREIQQSVSLISIFTCHYHERSSCREEVRQARQPRQIQEQNCWQITPLIVVDALAGQWAQTLQEFVGCQIIRWEENLEEVIIDRALIEAVLSAYHRRWAEKLADSQHVAINWVPDVLSLLQLQAEQGLPDKCTVVYPRHVTATDLSRLKLAFRHITFRKFEELHR